MMTYLMAPDSPCRFKVVYPLGQVARDRVSDGWCGHPSSQSVITRPLLDQFQALQIAIAPTDISDQVLEELRSVSLARVIVNDNAAARRVGLDEASGGPTFSFWIPVVFLKGSNQSVSRCVL